MPNLIAKRCTAKRTKWSFSNLSNANFSDGTELNASFFDYSILFNSLFSNITAKNISMNNVFAHSATFTPSVNLKGVNFRHAILTAAQFNNIDCSKGIFSHSNVTIDQLLSAKNINKITVNGFTALEKKRLQENGYIIYFDENPIPIQGNHFRKIKKKLDVERITNNLDQSLLWDDDLEEWKHDVNWNGGNKGDRVAYVKKNSPLFKTITDIVYATSDNISYQSTRFEIARLLRAYKKDADSLKKFILSEMDEPPCHLGEPGSISIENILVIKNKQLWKRYQNKKQALKKDLNEQQVPSLKGVTLHSENLPGNLPVLDQSCGETWLFHSTGQDIMHKITQGGFAPKISEKKPIRGYGALGQGVYGTDSFAKAATYSLCPNCDQTTCQCETPPLKATILYRSLLGSTFPDPHKSRKEKTEPPNGYHSCWGPYDQFFTNSAFDCNEFLVCEKDQTYPEFVIYFRDHKKLIKEMDPETLAKKTLLPLPNELQHIPNLSDNIKDAIRLYYPLVLINDNMRRYIGLMKIYHMLGDEAPDHAADSYALLYAQVQKELNQLLNEFNDIVENEYLSSHYHCIEYTLAKNKQWHDLILTSTQAIQFFSDDAEHYYFKATGYFYCHEFRSVIENINIALKCDKQKTMSMLNSSIGINKKEYFNCSLEQITLGYIAPINHKQWVESVCERHTAIEKIKEINTWETSYWKLPSQYKPLWLLNAQNKISGAKRDNEYLIQRINNLPNKNNVHEKIQQQYTDWEDNLNALISDEPVSDEPEQKTDICISWLRRNSIIEQGALSPAIAKQIFDMETGEFLKIGSQNDGRSWTNCLMQDSHSGKEVAFIKLFPLFPTRQVMVDMLVERLSGYSIHAIIGKITHPMHNTPIPILLTIPSGKTLSEYHTSGKDTEIEKSLDSYHYTWKVFESWLIQNFDEKGDNLAIIPIQNKSGTVYRFVVIDSDEVFELSPYSNGKLNYNSVILLCDLFKEPMNPAAIEHWRSLETYKILTDWGKSIEKLAEHLIGETPQHLFRTKEVNQIEKLGRKNSVYSNKDNDCKYNQTSLINAGLRHIDIENIYHRATQITKALATSSLPQITHERFIQKLHRLVAACYSEAIEYAGDSACERFNHLPGAYVNFTHEITFHSKHDPHGKGKEEEEEEDDDDDDDNNNNESTHAPLDKQTTLMSEKVRSFTKYITQIPTIQNNSNNDNNEILSLSFVRHQVKSIQLIHDAILDFDNNRQQLQFGQKIETLTSINSVSMKDALINSLDWLNFTEPFKTALLQAMSKYSFKTLISKLSHDELNDILSASTDQLEELAIINIDTENFTFSPSPQLNTLYLSYIHLPENWELKSPRIESLHIAHCDSIHALFLSLPRLKKLGLQDCKSLEKFSLISESISTWKLANLEKLQLIRLNGKKFTPEEFSSLNPNTISSLPLQCIAHSINENDLRYFKHLTLIKTRDIILNGSDQYDIKAISANKITIDLIEHLYTHAVSELHLSDLPISTKIMKEIIDKNKVLRVLKLSNCPNIDSSISNSIRDSESLKKIHINGLDKLTEFNLCFNPTHHFSVPGILNHISNQHPTPKLIDCRLEQNDNLKSVHIKCPNIQRLLLPNNSALSELSILNNKKVSTPKLMEINIIQTALQADSVLNAIQRLPNLQYVICEQPILTYAAKCALEYAREKTNTPGIWPFLIKKNQLDFKSHDDCEHFILSRMKPIENVYLITVLSLFRRYFLKIILQCPNLKLIDICNNEKPPIKLDFEKLPKLILQKYKKYLIFTHNNASQGQRKAIESLVSLLDNLAILNFSKTINNGMGYRIKISPNQLHVTADDIHKLIAYINRRSKKIRESATQSPRSPFFSTRNNNTQSQFKVNNIGANKNSTKQKQPKY